MKKNFEPRTALHVLEAFIQCIVCDRKTVYLAGPDVFYPNPIAIGEEKKRQCEAHGYTGLYPLDNKIPEQKSKRDVARLIFEGNVNLINKSDIIIANLNKFRGACDSGTMWEVGYGLAKGKIVIGYSKERLIIPKVVRNNIYYIKANSFEECLKKVDNMDFSRHETKTIVLRSDMVYNLDPSPLGVEEIFDADALNSFYIGYLYGTGCIPKARITDKRSQVEKYGTERNGCSVEDFDLPYNLMMYFSSELV